MTVQRCKAYDQWVQSYDTQASYKYGKKQTEKETRMQNTESKNEPILRCTHWRRQIPVPPTVNRKPEIQIEAPHIDKKNALSLLPDVKYFNLL
jgi:hypothetical protein